MSAEHLQMRLIAHFKAHGILNGKMASEFPCARFRQNTVGFVDVISDRKALIEILRALK